MLNMYRESIYRRGKLVGGGGGNLELLLVFSLFSSLEGDMMHS